ncbi:MAG: hypothetical protein K8S14_11160 [Actinomycetia bacterium]|nr:hypothetical protein [Actinomycetes bacterium]
MSTMLISCISEPKYTYEEYKKIKAMTTDKGREDIAEDLPADDNTGKDELHSFSNDLNDYYLYIEEFRSIYDRHTSELFILFDDFDGEKEDIDKKNHYADSIIAHEEGWIDDLEEIAVPGFLDTYHICFMDYLNKEVLFYKYFLEADLEKANDYAMEADDLRERSFVELEAVEKIFNDRAKKLSLEPPF